MQWGDVRLPERFWNKTTPEPNTGCWLWTGAHCDRGYGLFRLNGKNSGAHRHAYKVVNSDYTDKFTEHRCGIRSCVNPSHIRMVTRSENLQFKGKEGERFGKLVVVRRTVHDGRAMWLCRCDCGKELPVPGGNLGGTGSCGCLRPNPGKGHESEFSTWKAMLYRCTDPRSKDYWNYGARGIGVCERWLDFKNFLADMGPRPVDMSLDRTDNNRGYSPDNCRWADRVTQASNRRGDRRHMQSHIDRAIVEVAEGGAALHRDDVLRLLRVLRFSLLGVDA